LSWLPFALAGLLAGLFGARAAFEFWPARLMALGTWPGTLGVVAIAVLIALVLRWMGWRSSRPIFNSQSPIILFPFLLLLFYIFWPRVNLLMAASLLIAAIGLSVALVLNVLLPPGWQRLSGWIVLAGLVTIVLVAYLQTMGRTVGEADTFEFQVVAPVLGVAHPTGYPLLILIGKLFSLIPLGQVAWRVNLVSVTCSTAVVVLLYLSLRRLTGQRAIPALAALGLAFSRTFWSQATQVEVYSLNAMFVAAILWLLIARHDNASTSGARWLFVLAALYGLSLTNHLTMVILAPAIAVGVLLMRPRLQLEEWLITVGCFIVPLLIILFIPLRWPALHNGQGMSFNAFIAYVTGQQFGGALQFGLARDPTRWNIVSGMMLGTFGPVGAVLAALGLVWLAVRKWRLALLTFIAFAGYWFYGLIYNVPDVSVFIIPAHVIMALWIGAATAQLAHWLSSRLSHSEPSSSPEPSDQDSLSGEEEALPSPSIQGQDDNKQARPAHWIAALAWVAFAILPLYLAWTNGPLVDQSQVGWELYRWGKYTMDLPMPAGSAILADSEKIAPLYYLKRIENIRPDVETIVLGDEGLYRNELDRRVAAGQPVYLARYLPGIAGPYRLHSLGPLARVTTRPMLTPPPMTRQLNNINWGGGKIALLGLDVEPGAGDVAWHITLYWLARSKLDADYHVRLRWVGPNGQVWWQDHGAHPVSGYNPTGAWQPGEIIADYHEIPADPTIPPGLLQLDVGWFLPFLDEGLNRDGTTSPWFATVLLEQILPNSPRPLAHDMRATFGDELLITGASDLGVLPPGEPVSVEFEWSRIRGGADRTLQLRWTDARGAKIETMQVRPYADEFPTSQWPEGRALRSRLSIASPARPGMYTLRASWLDADGRALLARCAWLASPSYECAVGTLRVEGEARPGEQGINFDNQVLLLDAQIGQTQLRPGESLPVNLRWQGLRQWNADYTVFVHLIGPDGKVHGQVDQWPLDGTLATRDWQPGRVVDDPYRVTVPGDAPPGAYQVEVGWYLLATLRRLPIVDAEGRPVDDRVIIGTVTVNSDQ
jgi:hypothetical protein